MSFILPCKLVKQVLNAAGFTDVNYGKFDARALSEPAYVFLEQLPGTTPHIRYANRPTMQIVCYVADADDVTGKDGSLRLAYNIQAALLEAVGTAFSEGGIHRVITRLDPHRVDLPGLPYGVGRTVAQYDLILASQQKWS